MNTKAQKMIDEFAARNGIHPLDAYYEIQEMCEVHRDVWDFGFAAGQEAKGPDEE